MTNIPDVSSRRVVAERVEVVSVPATPVPEQGQGQAPVDGWQGRVVPLCGSRQLDNYFEREDGVCFGIDVPPLPSEKGAPRALQEAFYIAECEGYPVRIWGTLYTGVDDYRGTRIVVERLEAIAATPTAMATPLPLGKIVWSPDGSALMLTQADNACSSRTTHTILRVDVATLAVRTLVAADSRLYTTEAWPELGRVLLVDKDEARWWMDANSGELTRAE